MVQGLHRFVHKMVSVMFGSIWNQNDWKRWKERIIQTSVNVLKGSVEETSRMDKGADGST